VIAHIDCGRKYKPGEPPPDGYLQRQEWARHQRRAGLRQRKCPRCGRWRFPQEFGKVNCKECEVQL
jgi:hypothetical protein